jgi:hypothetical protein
MSNDQFNFLRVKKYTGFNAGNKVAVVDAAKAKCLSGGCRG